MSSEFNYIKILIRKDWNTFEGAERSSSPCGLCGETFNIKLLHASQSELIDHISLCKKCYNTNSTIEVCGCGCGG